MNLATLPMMFASQFSSPRIVEVIIDGNQPRALTRTRLLATDLPVDWAEQEALLGIAA